AASSAQFEQAVAADHYLSGLPPGAPMRSLEEMLAKAGASVNDSLVATAGIASLDDYAPFLSALKQQDVLRAALVAVMDRHELEALVLPYRTLPPPDLAAGTMTAADRKDRRNGLHAYT